ncbi:MAG: serine/threonine-protein kinase, partial [Candidatus Acidiferrales bacterium]
MTDDVTGARKGDYLILGTLGAGGMGKVYKVRNTLSDRIEAMKVLLPDLSDQKDLADRFLREIKVLASLHHPNIAELRTALTIDNQLVMIMEYVEGSTLAARLLQGPVRYADALAYFDQVLAALSCAHALRIVHRDIKPANIMLTPQGVVKLMDFGIARSGNDLGLTMTGTTLGSVAYMSPEQVRCEPIDGRSDLYSVGVSLYETITGQRPYVSENNFEIMQAHLQIPPTPPSELKPDIPPALSQLILMAMAKDPAERFQTADALRAALMSLAPSFGPPTQSPATIHESTLDMTAPPTPRPVAPPTPRPVTARPITARPVTARPITAQPAAPPEHAVDLPLASAGRGIYPPPLAPTVPLATP